MHKSLNRILLATEGTEFDAGAERVAIDLAATCQLALLVVRPIFSNTELGIVAPKITEATDAEAATQMDQLRQAASKRGVELLIVIRHGEEIHKEILADAREREVDLIVIRRRGKRSYLAKL